MHCSRSVYRSPSVVRIARCSPHVRNASFFPTPFLPRFPGAAWAAHNDFAPLFRLFDDFTGPSAPQSRSGFNFHPRFDVREVDDTYELRGELPGVEGKDIEVEFTDPQTLIVRGHTERETTSGTPPTTTTADTEAEATKAVADTDNSDAASNYSTGSYQKPSVEDGEEGEVSAVAAETKEPETAPETTTEKPLEKAPEEPQQTSRYWVSERSTGSFQRVFNFPAPVDQDAVKASIKNGILSIVVPKAAAPAAKKINVE